MGNGKAEWIAIAADASEWLAGKPPKERRGLMADRHRRGGVSPHNLQRMIVAYEYLISNGKNAGVDLPDVVASYAAIEALLRIDRIDPIEAAAQSRAVLLGQKSVKEITNILAVVREGKARAEAVETPERWRVYYEETLSALGFGPGTFSVDNAGHSLRGRTLLVDIEVLLDSRKRAAVFLSPLCRFSSFAKKPLTDQLPRVLTALAYYDEVHYVVYDEDERTLIEGWMREGEWHGKTIRFREPAPWDIEIVDPGDGGTVSAR